jgi:hypothetical protein
MRVLLTLREAADLLLSFGEGVQAHKWIEHAAELLLTAAAWADKP